MAGVNISRKEYTKRAGIVLGILHPRARTVCVLLAAAQACVSLEPARSNALSCQAQSLRSQGSGGRALELYFVAWEVASSTWASLCASCFG